MHTSLSDLLVCPRCGPTYGLVLLPGEVRDQRVVAGVLGCANCRERYRIEGGEADLRVVGGTGSGAPRGVGEREAAVRLAALMGLAEARGTVLVAGPAAAHAEVLAGVVPDVEVVAVDGVPSPRVSSLRVAGVLPFRSGSLRGVARTGERAKLVEEGARVLGPAGRLVVEPAPAGARQRLESAGLRVLAEEGDTVVSGRGD
ncbi:MAG: hypothetical protein P8177_01680 [Gemmatimonadota bacterium]